RSAALGWATLASRRREPGTTAEGHSGSPRAARRPWTCRQPLSTSKQLKRAVLALAVSLVAAMLATSTVATGSSTKIACGSERWNVKTLQDRPKLKAVKNTTIAQLVTIPQPSSLPATRLADEFRVYRVTARVTLVRHEGDDDFHLVIQ